MTIIDTLKREIEESCKGVRNMILIHGADDHCACCGSTDHGNRYVVTTNSTYGRCFVFCTRCMSAYCGGEKARKLMEVYGSIVDADCLPVTVDGEKMSAEEYYRRQGAA